MESNQPFMILGHGAENIETPFESRHKLPAGYTLVTLSECGSVTVMETVSRFLAAFKDNAAIDFLSNPAKPANKEIIQKILEKSIHVYKPGQLYPNLEIKALVDWLADDEKSISLMKSGLYSFPLDSTLFTEPYSIPHSIEGGIGFSKKFPESFAEPINNLYNGSIFPTNSLVSDALKTSKMKISEFAKAMTFPLETFFQAGGPGVYFYVICRSPQELNVNPFVQEYVPNKNLVQSIRETQNIIPFIPLIIPYSDAVAQKEKNRLMEPGSKKRWYSNEHLEMSNKLAALHNRTMRTRSKSIEQQNAEGGRRRSRQKNKAIRKKKATTRKVK
jgi:hypothetical protein